MDLADLRSLKGDLLTAQLRKEVAEAEIMEYELAVARDKEADRLARPGKNRELMVFGAISSGNSEAVIDMLNHWNRRDKGEPITITFNSPGGSVIDGFAVYDTIQRLKRDGHKIITRGTGMAASMGAILLQAGDERILDKRAFMLIHEVSSGTAGRISDMEDDLVFARKLQDTALDILAERSKMTKRQIANKWKRKDWWLSADEALELGFVDKVE